MADKQDPKVIKLPNGKMAYVDVNAHQITVFDPGFAQKLASSKVTEPSTQAYNQNGEVFMLLSALNSLMPGDILMDEPIFIAGGDTVYSGEDTPTVDLNDPLGEKEHYILVGSNAVLSQAFHIYAWVTEHAKGYKPDYKNHSKHRIMPEQFEWLNIHKNCSIIGWFDICPLYPAVACQQHAVVVRPVYTHKGIAKNDIAEGSHLEISKVQAKPEIVWAEEREI